MRGSRKVGGDVGVRCYTLIALITVHRILVREGLGARTQSSLLGGGMCTDFVGDVLQF